MEIETKEIELLIEAGKDAIRGACIDRRPLAMAVLDKICEPLRHVPRDIAPRLYKDAKIQLSAERIRDAIERGDSIDAALNDCRANVLNVIAYERREGSLKPWSASDEIARFTHKFFAESWNGNEIAGARSLLKPKAHLLDVVLRQIETDAGVLTRAAVHAYILSQRAKIGDVVSDEAYTQKFLTSESTLRELENARAIAERERIRKQTTHQSGPPSIIGTPIRQN